MSVQSYLENLASRLVISTDEKSKITKSIATLSTRLDSYFGGELERHFMFGSYTRGTILPRKVDEYSDIDYMVIFKNPNGYKPQTLLNYLRGFAKKYYSTSEIHQDHPTMVLELQHIKFELVPAKKDWLGNLYIPSRLSHFEEWIMTDPNSFNEKLTKANTSNSSKIKPLVRLMKYWNRKNGDYLSSYDLENYIVDRHYWFCYNLKDYVYNTIDNLSYNWNDPQSYKDKVERAKKIINETRGYEAKNMPISAEAEIKKLFPEF